MGVGGAQVAVAMAPLAITKSPMAGSVMAESAIAKPVMVDSEMLLLTKDVLCQ